jgi:NAD(P)-dependent dehydrogenase (short-subunit alcohol dehydrogenase family)
MLDSQRKFAIVTGASTGIGLELARECAKHKFDLLIAANEPQINNAADDLRREGGGVETVQADLATLEGVDKLYEKINGRRVDALLANAGRGLDSSNLDYCELGLECGALVTSGIYGWAMVVTGTGATASRARQSARRPHTHSKRPLSARYRHAADPGRPRACRGARARLCGINFLRAGVE